MWCVSETCLLSATGKGKRKEKKHKVKSDMDSPNEYTNINNKLTNVHIF